MQEQSAYSPLIKRASATHQELLTREQQSASRHKVGHNAGLHPEDPPYFTYTQQRGARTPKTYSSEMDDVSEDDSLYSQKTGSSVIVRNRPTTVQPVRSASPPPHKTKRQKPHLLYIGLVSFALTFGFVAAAYLPPLFQRWNDDREYGYPRTYQINAIVGHSDPKSPYSHFIALNDKGAIEVIEIPNGDRSKYKPQLYMIGELTNQGADLVPVTISFADMNGDGKPDLIVQFNNSMWIWYNDGSTFKP